MVNKLKWILGITLIFVLIITTNLIDRNNFVRVKDSVETIYYDRIVASDIIFQLTQQFKNEELSLVKNNVIENSDHTIDKLIVDFENTKLTLLEEKSFKRLTANYELLQQNEQQFTQDPLPETKNKIHDLYSAIDKNLNDLSKIQIDEGKRQTSISRRAIDTVELFTQMEIYILIFLAIVIQIIILYNPKKKEEE